MSHNQGDEEGLSFLGPFAQSGDTKSKGCPGHPRSFLPATSKGGRSTALYIIKLFDEVPVLFALCHPGEVNVLPF